MICPRCATPVPDQVNACGACGYTLRAAGAAEPPSGYPSGSGWLPPPPPPAGGSPGYPPPPAPPPPGYPHPYQQPYQQPYQPYPPPGYPPYAPYGAPDQGGAFLGLSPRGIALLAVFLLPWVIGRVTFWSWSGGGGPGIAKFILYYPLIAGGLLIAASRGQLPAMARAGITLVAGAVPLVVLMAELPGAIGGLARSASVVSLMRLFGPIALGAGCTMRVLSRDTKIGRFLIGGGVALTALGFFVPTQEGAAFDGKSHNFLWLAWKLVSMPRVPAGIKMLSMVMLATPFIALLGLLLLKQVARGDSDPAQGAGRILGGYFVFWMPLQIGFGSLMLLSGMSRDGGGMLLWVMMKVMVYVAVVVVWLNHGLVALLHNAEKPPGAA